MSNINPLNINGAYPVAGVDNDSQGFRDNFTNIKNNFAYAQSELNDLQSKAIVKSALTGTTLNNNMAGTLISSALIQDFRETEYDNGVISTTVTLDHAQGHYQRVQTNASIAIAFTNSAHRMTLPAAVSYGLQYLQDYNANTRSIGYSQSGVGTYWYEFISDDAGATITVIPLSRARNNIDYTYANIANGTAASPTATTMVTKLILDNGAAGALSNVSVTFPPYPVDGQVVQISANVNVSNLFLLHANTINGNTTTLSAGAHLGYTYVGYPRNPGVEKWFKTQI